MCDLRGLSKYEVNQHYFEFVRNATKEEREEHGWNNSNTRGIYKCRECGKLHYFNNHSFKKCLQVCDNECNGTAGGGKGTVVHGYNDLKTTHQELVKYFINPEDAKKYTYSSNQKVLLKCPECGKEKWMSLTRLSQHGFSCDQCSDGVSYPEKIMALVLSELNIKFGKQLTYDDSKHKYDFHIKKWNTIIEIHGGQHYEGYRDSRWKTYEEEHENDLYKYDLAVLNGYEYNKNFFIIDARESNIEYLRHNIERCKFFKQFNLTDIDWNKIDKNAQKSLKIEVCKYWNEHENLTPKDLGKVFGVSKVTIINYLNWGNKSGLCIYDGKEEKIKKNNRQSIFVFLIKESGEKWFDEPLSLKGLSRKTGISLNTLCELLQNKKTLIGGNRSKYDPKYIGSVIVLAEPTE